MFIGAKATRDPTLVGIWQERADSHGDAIALRFLRDDGAEIALTWGELDRRARRIAGAVAHLAGERALLLFPPGPDYVAAFAGCLYAGVIAVPVLPPKARRPHRLAAITRDARPALALTTRALEPLVAAAIDTPRLATDALPDGAPSGARPVDPGDVAFLQYTSGSTGDPKGVVVRHANLLANMRSIARRFALRPDDHVLSWLPPHHDMGLIGCLLTPALAPCPVTALSPAAFLRDPLRWLSLIASRGATISGGPNFAFALCARRASEGGATPIGDLGRWRLAFCGAERVRPETLRAFASAFAPVGFSPDAFAPCYGLAEATLLVSGRRAGTGARAARFDRRDLERHRVTPLALAGPEDAELASCGPVADTVHVRVVDPSSGRDADGVGEILVAGPSVGAGYHSGATAVDGDGWLRTGDLGFVWDGELWITGRRKDVVIVRGRNLSPDDIERIVDGVHPAVLPGRSAAFAVDADGEEQLAVVCEVTDPRARGEVMASIRAAVARQLDVRLYAGAAVRRGALPITSSGKVRRSACRDAFLAGAFGDDAPRPSVAPGRVAGAPGLTERIAAWAGIAPGDVDPDAPLDALGIDSGAALDLCAEITRELGVSVPVTALLDRPTLAELTELVARAPAVVSAAPDADPLPSTLQEALWLEERLRPGHAGLEIGVELAFDGPVDPNALADAVDDVVDRWPVLGVCLPERDGRCYLAAGVRPRLRVGPRPAASTGFDLARGPLVDVELVAPDRLRIVAHHAVADGGTLGVALAALAERYAARVRHPAQPRQRAANGQTAVTPEAWAAWAASERFRVAAERSETLAWWRRTLADLPATTLAIRGRAPPAEPVEVPAAIADRLRSLADAEGATLFVGLLAVFGALVARLTREIDVGIGVVAAVGAPPDGVGPRVNPVVVRLDAAAALDLRGAIRAARTALHASLDHGGLPFAEVVGDARARGIEGLGQLLVDLQRAPTPLRFGALQATVRELAQSGGDPARAAVSLRERADGAVCGSAPYGRALARLVHRAVDAPDQPLNALELVDAADAATLARFEVGPPAFGGSARSTLHGRFEAYVAAVPEAAAVVTADGRTLTRQALWDVAGGWAQALADAGAAPGEPIGVCCGRSETAPIAILAVLRAGCAWVALDPEWPAQRIGSVVEDTGVRTVLADRSSMDRASDGASWLAVDGPCPTVACARSERAAPAPTDDRAYVIATSGSTGRPKGVMGTHAGLSGIVDAVDAVAPLPPGAAYAVVASWAFDAALWELFAGLCAGGVIHVAPDEVRRDGAALCAWLDERAIASAYVPAVHLEALAGAADAGTLRLRRLLAGAEVIPVGRLARIARAGVQVVHAYGPTEASVAVTLWKVPGAVPGELAPDEPGPIGSPIAGARIALVDADLRRVPVGAPGELVVFGRPLALGYVAAGASGAHDPADTGGFCVVDGFRAYRTGDLARWRADGSLVFLGRIDAQLKVRGQRVEPAEVERVIGRLDGVAEVTVGANLDGTGLVAWIVGADDAVDPASVRAWCRRWLPAALVPQVVRMDALPRGTSGKVDRARCPQPVQQASSGHGEAPRTPTEVAVAAVFAGALDVARVSLDDDLFALGADSLAGARVAARIRAELGVELALRDVFDAPSVRALADRIDACADRAAPAPMPRVARGPCTPMSPAQRRFRLLHARDPRAWAIPVAVRLVGGADVDRLEAALGRVIARHEALRTVFTDDGLRVLPDLRVPIRRARAASDAEAARLAGEDAAAPFDLAEGPLVRALWIEADDDARDPVLAVTFHHLVCDGRSVGLVWRAWAAAYAQPEVEPAAPALGFADWAAWRAAQPAGDPSFWREALAELAPLPDLGWPAARDTGAVRVVRALDPNLCAALDAYARTIRASRFSVLAATLGALIARLSGRSDVVIGAPIEDRSHPAAAELVGLLLDVLPLRVRVDDAPSLDLCAARCRDGLLAAEARRDVPYDQIVAAAGRSGSDGLYDVVLNVARSPLAEHAAAGGDLRPVPFEVPPPPARIGLTLYADPAGPELALVARGGAPRDRVVEVLDQLVLLLDAAVRAPHLPLSHHSLVTPRARAALPDPTQVIPLTRHDSVAYRLVALADRDPERPALASCGEVHTIGALIARARTLAEDTPPGRFVVVSGPPGFETVARLVSVWLAGSVVVPLDPALPPERRRVCERIVAGAPDAKPGDAYVFFTSGTTGQPKPVVGTHAGLAQFVDWQVRTFALGPSDRAAHLTGLGFDVVLRELFSPLVAGAVVVAPDDALRDADTVVPWLAREGITVVHTVPTLASSWVAAERAARPKLRITFFAGEPLRDTLVDQWSAAFGGRIVNLYGPTETTLAKCYAELPAGPAAPGVQSVGHAMPGATVWVHGDAGPCGVGEVGEVRIATPYRTRGYLGERDTGPVYLTGDLGRHDLEGALSLLGRRDDQVKIGGVRVEPGEVAAILESHPAVAQAAVIVVADGDRKCLVGHYAPLDVASTLLLAWAKARLPAAAVPAALVGHPRLPTNANGKVDRRALAALGLPTERASSDTAPLPADALQVELCAAWTRVLGRPVGPRDDFFTLGGQSLAAMELVGWVRRALGAPGVPVDALFDARTVERFADVVRAHQTGDPLRIAPTDGGSASEAEPGPPDAPYPLLPVQAAYWLGRQSAFALGGVATGSYQELVVPGGIDVQRLERAIRALITRHDALRTEILPDGAQRALSEAPAYAVRTVDGPPEAVRAELLAAPPSDGWPQFAFAVSRSGGETRLHVMFDAIAVDAFSGRILARELAALYATPDAALPPIPITFREVAVRSVPGAAVARERDRAWWSVRVADLPEPPELALDPRAPTGGPFVRRTIHVPRAQWTALVDRAAADGITASVVALTVYAEAIALFARRRRFTLTTTVHDRPPVHGHVDRVVGNLSSIALVPIALGDPARSAFVDRARAVAGALWEVLDHRGFSGLEVLRELGRSGRRAGMPFVFTSTLGLGRDEPVDPPLVDARPVFGRTRSAQVLANVGADPAPDGGLILRWDTVDTALGAPLVDRMVEAAREALVALGDPRTRAEAYAGRGRVLARCRTSERLVAEVNATARPVMDEPLTAAFLRHAEAHPDRVAVIGSVTLTYGALRERARALALTLVDRGVARGEPVGVVMDKGWEQVVAVVGIALAGAAWLPVAAELPPARVRRIAALAGLRFAVTTASVADRLALPDDVAVVDVDARPGPDQRSILPPGPSDTDLAYVIYTSGSTGAPKGVAIDAGGVIRTLQDVNARFAVGPADRVLGVSSLSFDLSVWDVWGLLSAGGALVLPDPDHLRDPAHWAALIEAHGVTVWNSVPALFEMLIAHPDVDRVGSLRLAMLSGDWIPVTLPDRARARLPGLSVVSLGGATEASIWSVVYPIGEVDPSWVSIPYGKPMANQTLHVLDEVLQPRPVGAVGELWIGGRGVALGYWRDEVRTGERFVDHPALGRLYRTGDLGRLLPSGDVVFLGREDHQIKLGGHRIELGEVEAALLGHAAVAEAVAIARADRLLAYVVAAAGLTLEPDDVLDHVRARLPGYMVPAVCVRLDALPLGATGKVDRARLPEPVAAGRTIVAPRTDTERALVALFAEVLGRESAEVSVDDPFFELGGDSIQGIQLVARAAAAGLAVSARDLFVHGTVAALAPHVTARTPVSARIAAEPGPLAPIQRWFLDQRFDDEHHWNQAVRLDVAGAEPDDPGAARRLLDAVRTVVGHHDALRLRLVDRDRLTFAPPDAAPELRWVADPDALDALAPALHAGFDLARGPVLAVGACPGSALIAVHHLAIDGISWRVLLEDLASALAQLRAGASVERVALPATSAAFTAWTAALPAAAERLAEHARFWLDAPWHRVRARSVAATDTVGAAVRHHLAVSAAALGPRPADRVLAALAGALADVDGTDCAAIDLEGHGREDALAPGLDVSRTVGWFTSLFPVVLDLAPSAASVPEQLARVPVRGAAFGVLRAHGSPSVREALGALPRPGVSFDHLGRLATADASSGIHRSARTAGPTRSPIARRRDAIEVISAELDGVVEVTVTAAPGAADLLCERFAARLGAEILSRRA